MALPPLWKYTLIQIPEAIVAAAVIYTVRGWLDLPHWLAAGAMGAWIVKDVVIYPLVRDALADDRDRVGPGRLVGEAGIAQDKLEPSGYVRVRGELWQAKIGEGDPPIPAGARVRVRAVEGLVLRIDSYEKSMSGGG